MEGKTEELIKKIRTKEELVFLLEEIARKKIELGKEEIYKLEKKLQSLPEIKLKIAFSPDDNFINKIGQWIEKELGQKIILDITVNPKVVAGAIIEYQGNWRDFSSAKEIDRLFIKELTNPQVNELRK